MHFTSTTLAGLGLMAATASAAPTTLNAAAGALNVVYWGQNGGGTIENNDLSSYCDSSSGIDVLVLSFLYEYGNGNTIASGTIGQSCYISPQGQPQQCDDLAAAVATCKSNGVKIILSLGGAAGAYSLSSSDEAATIGQNLWDAWGNAANGSVPRPFGSTFVDGEFMLSIRPCSSRGSFDYVSSGPYCQIGNLPSSSFGMTTNHNRLGLRY
jgi:chitinase